MSRAGRRKAGRPSTNSSGSLLAAAKEAHAAGRAVIAEGLYAQVIKNNPADAVEAHRCLALLCSQTNRLAPAIEHLTAAIRLDPNDAGLLNDLGTLHVSANRVEEAVAAYRQAVALRPNFPQALLHLGTALHREGSLAEAERCYRRAIALAPKMADACLNLGSVLQQLGNYAEAEAAFRRALALNPRSSGAHLNLGSSLAAQGRIDDAITAYRAALEIEPMLAPAHLYLGAAHQQRREHEKAVECYKRAVEIDPAFAVAIHNLGCTLSDLGRLDEAILWFRRAVGLHPESPLAHKALAVALRDRGLTDEAFDSFRRHSDLALRLPQMRADPAIPPYKTKHDREQLEYLAQRGFPAAAALREEIARAPLPPEQFHERFGAILHIEGGERIEPPAVNPRADKSVIEAQWLESRPQIVVVDDLLSPRALRELRRFCWGSTIWRGEYSDGYLGTMMEGGFAAPLILQIGKELAAAFPKIFRAHPLLQAWAFKYDSALRGIAVHADFAAVNVNFWISPDEANLDPHRGGLVIWDQPAPLDWDFEKYNKEVGAIRDFLARSGAKPVTVPHRANRAVIFDSDLFHETDRIVFKEGYLNRRINVTFLYGRREHAGASHGALNA